MIVWKQYPAKSDAPLHRRGLGRLICDKGQMDTEGAHKAITEAP